MAFSFINDVLFVLCFLKRAVVFHQYLNDDIKAILDLNLEKNKMPINDSQESVL